MPSHEPQRNPEVARAAFERAVLPHLPAAYNLARWLARDAARAEDLTQEAVLRALRFFDGFRGGDARAWLLTIVRNVFYSQAARRRPEEEAAPFDAEKHGGLDPDDPEALLLSSSDRGVVRRALEELPADFREVIVLRELEGLSYREIAAVTAVPQGTVMSRLARARRRLQERLNPSPNPTRPEVPRDV